MLAELSAALKEAADIFASAKEMRHAYSMPKTEEQAAKWRKSKRWQTADAAFKFMDKLGYLSVLRIYSRLASSGELTTDSAAEILRLIQFDKK